MTRDEVRNHLLNLFKTLGSDNFASVSNKKDIIHTGGVIDHLRKIEPADPPHSEPERNIIVLEIINEWITNGLLVYGNKEDPYGNTHGWLTLTDYGRECFDQNNMLPYDPDGYISEFKQQVPTVDPITLNYLSESIAAYNRDLLLSSTITLGVASENMILLLIEAFTQAISDQPRKTGLENRLRDRFISTQFGIFRTELTHFENQLPTNLRRDLDTYLDGVFNFIRLNRNQAGHPTGNRPTKRIALHNLQVFVDYSKRVFALIDHLNSNPLT